jgi:hypothetical protein
MKLILSPILFVFCLLPFLFSWLWHLQFLVKFKHTWKKDVIPKAARSSLSCVLSSKLAVHSFFLPPSTLVYSSILLNFCVLIHTCFKSWPIHVYNFFHYGFYPFCFIQRCLSWFSSFLSPGCNVVSEIDRLYRRFSQFSQYLQVISNVV